VAWISVGECCWRSLPGIIGSEHVPEGLPCTPRLAHLEPAFTKVGWRGVSRSDAAVSFAIPLFKLRSRTQTFNTQDLRDGQFKCSVAIKDSESVWIAIRLRNLRISDPAC
jgi:hypothetical protein